MKSFVLSFLAVAILAAQTPYPRSFTDAKGHKVTLAAKPVRMRLAGLTDAAS